MKRWMPMTVGIAFLTAIISCAILHFGELDWDDFAIINDVTIRPVNGISYHVVAVDGQPEKRMRGKFQSRAPLVLTTTGTLAFDVRRTEDNMERLVRVSSFVKTGCRYRIAEEDGVLSIVPENPL